MRNKLTNALREECVKSALAHALDKRKEELRAKRCAFANEVLDDDEPNVRCRALVPSATLNERLGLPVDQKA